MLTTCITADRFKNFQYSGATDEIRKLAHTYLRNNFQQNFLPKSIKQPEATSKPTIPEPRKKKKKSTVLATFLVSDDEDGSYDEDEDIDVPIASLVPGIEELDAYIGLPQVNHVDRNGEEVDVLLWWKEHAHMFPNLSKMARQYLAMPASSAGVERLFSAAGRMHSSFRKSTKEESLEIQLIVYQNA